MLLPVIRGKIGNWRYYTGLMTFKQVAEYITPSIGELYQAKCLDELLQRELTTNYEAIRDYILKDGERFFNALILAIYDGDPQWLEAEFENESFTNVGFLSFSGNENIFPVDGQHRVAGIKAAIEENDALSSETIPVVFIAHAQSDEGRKRTRKLFSTLNRRAKPVGQNENIALDEDDACAIITRILGVEDLENCAFKAAGGEYGSIDGAPFGIGGDDGGHGLADLLDTDAALGAFVDDLDLNGIVQRDLRGVNGVVDPVGFDGLKLLDVYDTHGQVGRGSDAAAVGGHGLYEMLTGKVGVNAELDAGKEGAVIALLYDAQTSEGFCVDGNGSGGNDLCGRGAHEHVLKIVSVGDICRHVRYAAGVPALSGKHEGAAVKGLSGGNSERIVAGTGVAVNGHAGGELRGVEGIAAVDVCKRYSGLTCVDAAVLGEPERSGIESDVVLNSIPVPRVLEELVCPGKHVLVAGLGADPVGMSGAVREAEGTRFALLGEPETDRVGSRLTGFVIGKALGKVAGIAVHEYRLQAFESSRAEERRGRGLGVAVAVGVALGVLDTVDDFTGLHYPVARRIEVLPCAVGVILQVIERTVILRLDRNSALGVGTDGMGVCENAHWDEGNAEKRRKQQRDETCRFLHLIFRLFLKRHPFSAVFAVFC